ncbi:PilT/PilU family type 4a pilus ATPase [Planctomycetota bacterium]|nr:PilT/PilU family type 4a pilus ATPase [Planctomycetota bacterium]
MSEVKHAEEAVGADHLDDRRSMADTDFFKYFEAAVRFEASDLLMRAGQVPKLRLRGSLKNLDVPAIEVADFERQVEASLSPKQWKQYADKGSIDLGVDFNIKTPKSGEFELHRFRINIFRTRGISGLAARRVNNTILNFEELHLPESVGNMCKLHQGLVLLAGVTGSGKSTTIAAMLDQINKDRACHILTIEDPIEYLFADKKSIVNQREVGIDLPDFDTGLRALVRENPDVVLIGEMRDKETFESALRAAETGHLVFGTIHASSAAQAFGRIYDLFPQEEREAIRNLLAYQMQGFIYQKLLPTLLEDVQRVPAVEILLQSPPTRKYIIEGREDELPEVMKEFREAGMQTFTDSLIDLVHMEKIHPRVAQEVAPSPEEVKMRLRGINA